MRSPKSESLHNKKFMNQDLFVEPQSEFMIRNENMYVPDNCEKSNPNMLRDPRLTLLEDENRLLKEEMKK